MRNCLSMVSWLYFFFALCHADRPEIKNDSDEVITSSSNQTQTVGGYALLNKTRRDQETYAQWMSMPDFWDNQNGEPIPYSSDMCKPDQTFHSFSHLGKHAGPTEAKTDTKAHPTPKMGVSKFMRVWTSTTPDFEPTLELEGMIAKHGKYMILKPDVSDFLDINHDMVQDTSRRVFEKHVFLYGYVMGPHARQDDDDAVYFHTYYVYAPDDAVSDDEWQKIERGQTVSPTGRETLGRENLNTRWDELKTNWIKLPDTINWASMLLESDGADLKLHEDGDLNGELQDTRDAAVWTTCVNKIEIDPNSIGLQTHIIHGKPSDAHEPEAYHALQIFESGKKAMPSDLMIGPQGRSSCRFQSLELTAFGVTAKPDAETDTILLEAHQLKTQTRMSLDANDLVLHLEYEMANDESPNFCTKTEEMFKSPHFKQSLLFKSTGTMLDGRTNHHMYLVFESVKKWFDHTHSKEMAAWMVARNTAPNAWMKLTDLVNMKSPELSLFKPVDKQRRITDIERLEATALRLADFVKPWTLGLERLAKNRKENLQKLEKGLSTE